MIRRIISGLGLSSAIIMVTMVGQILTVPILLTRWGAQIYGEWLTLTALAGTLSMLNLGVQSYVTNRLIAYYVRGEISRGRGNYTRPCASIWYFAVWPWRLP